jgi:hypothetical protein
VQFQKVSFQSSLHSPRNPATHVVVQQADLGYSKLSNNKSVDSFGTSSMLSTEKFHTSKLFIAEKMHSWGRPTPLQII